MGIPSYYKRLIDTVKGLLTRKHPTTTGVSVSYLWMDFNCLIYHCLRRPDMMPYTSARKEEWEAAFLDEIIKYTNKVIAEVKPTEGVYIAVDGVVPMAKMRQQRMRRFKSSAFAEEGTWDTNAITPGTDFMKKLRFKLEALCAKHPTWKVSSSDEPGEGEHKIMTAWKGKKGVQVVYGLDADLIVLSLLNAPDKVYLFREVVEAGEIKRNDLGEEEFSWFSIDELRNYLVGESIEKNAFLQDYCCAMSFLGNDFLPSSLAYKMREDGHDALMSFLRSPEHKRLVGDDGEISPSGLFAFLAKLASSEDARILAFIKKKARQGSVIGTETGFGQNNWPLAEQAESKLVSGVGASCSLKPNWQKIYLEHYFGKGTYSEELTSKYLYGVKWVWDYYRGKPICYNWHYPWHLPPLWKWLVSAKMPEYPGVHEIVPEEIRPEEQLALVLPLRSWHLVKMPEYQMPELAPWLYPKKFGYCSVGKRYFWECEAEIPVPSIIEIKSILAVTSTATKTK